jgi:uncharacterized protein (TIGR02996 family)
MTQVDSLFQAILDDPDDDAVRLVYADYLEEHGEPQRADFIRVQIELALLPEGDPRRGDLEARERALLKEHEGEWVAPLGEWAHFPEFHRGFVWGVMLDAPDFMERAEELFRTTPLRHARLSVDSKTMPALVASPWLARLTSLSFESCDLSYGDIGKLASSPYLTNLVTLDLYQNQTRSQGLRALADSPYLSKLCHLRLGWNGVGSAGLQALAKSLLLGHLTHISFFYNRIDGRGAAALAASPYAVSLTHVDFRGNYIDNAGGRALAESPYLTNLVWMDLHKNRVTEPTRDLLTARFGDRVQF